MNYIWRIRKFMPEYFGGSCHLVPLGNGKKSHKGKCVVEFEDGWTVVTSINFIRRKKDA